MIKFKVLEVRSPYQHSIQEINIRLKSLDKDIMRLTLQRAIVDLQLKKVIQAHDIDNQIQDLKKQLSSI